MVSFLRLRLIQLLLKKYNTIILWILDDLCVSDDRASSTWEDDCVAFAIHFDMSMQCYT
jgi:hypothetical protein